MLSTDGKVKVAQVASKFVCQARKIAGKSPQVVSSRRGITWNLDLREGIDFSIFLLGGFELRTLRRYRELVRAGHVVLDVGANIGAHTLPLAELVGASGRVHSFEPTSFAFAKQCSNIELNPTLEPRINSHQMMLSAKESDSIPELIYSSWPLVDTADVHTEHRGRLMDTNGATQSTLDIFVEQFNLSRLDFIKLDVDGNEPEVVAGAKNVLENFRPSIMLEIAPYLYDDKPERLEQLLEGLWDLGFSLNEMSSGRPLVSDPRVIKSQIPKFGSLNVLAQPSSR